MYAKGILTQQDVLYNEQQISFYCFLSTANRNVLDQQNLRWDSLKKNKAIKNEPLIITENMTASCRNEAHLSATHTFYTLKDP